MNILKNRDSIIIIVCTLLLSIFGVIMVYSASFYTSELYFADKFFYLKKQIVGVVIGIIGLIITSFVPSLIYKKFYIIFYIVGLVFLLLVFVPGLSKSSYGATRWIQIGSFSMQPSEIAKFCLIFALAGLFSNNDFLQKNKNIFISLILGGIYLLLIMLEPNMSITICLGLSFVFMLLLGGVKLRFFAIMVIPVIILGIILVLIEPYRLKRIIAFIDPWENPLAEGYQLIQSLYAIGGGGLFGVGLFNSRQARQFLPFSESDFIFSIIAEELGLIGCAVLIIVYLILIFTIFKVGIKAKNRFQSLLCFGIGAIICIQVIINIAVVTGSIPPTGLPLPFISAGSTSLFVFMSAIGVVLNVSKQITKNEN